MTSAKALLAMIALALSLACGVSLVAKAPLASAGGLPDARAYELVTSIPEESGLDGNPLFYLAAAGSGESVDWESLGSCCGASGGGLNTYQATRGVTGWQTKAIAPLANEPLVGLEELQEAVSWSPDLSRTLFSTAASYAPGNERPSGSGGSDLYLREPSGALKWVSQGPLGSGKGPYPSSFAGATADLGEVAFTTAEPLTANANGLTTQKAARYLYVRNVEHETTSLVDVEDSGKLITPYGASLGDAGPPKEGLFYFGFRGSTTNSISEDGSKLFFQTPPVGMEGIPAGIEPHLYMRDLANETTTPLDDPAANGSARFQGAAADGSLVFFTSDEELDGASAANELYVFNTTSQQIGQVPSMSSIPLAGGAGIFGATAIANDGSRVFFVADDVLTPETNSVGHAAEAGQPNLYLYEVATGETKFIATLAAPDVSTCNPTCAGGEPTGLVEGADIYRDAYTSPDGSVFVFTSSGSLTGEDHTPSTTLTYEAYSGERKIFVGSTAGFLQGRTVAIGIGGQEELDTIDEINGPTEITLSEYGPSFHKGLVEEHPAGAPIVQVNAEIYRYASADGALTCVSCTPPGVLSTQSASLGEVGGGSYAPPGYAPQMSEDGSRIFFDSPDPLVAGASEAVSQRVYEPTNVYEWDEGKVYLIADAADGGAVFNGTTSSGDDVFFTTRNALLPGVVAGFKHVYDARVNGGFATETPVGDPCAEEPCRFYAPTTPFLPAPASASMSDPSVAAGGQAPAKITVRGISAAQRVKLARSGSLVLTVSATAPGEVRATATAMLGGRRARVASAHGALLDAGALELTLRLSQTARLQLLRHGTLVLRIEVRYQRTGTVDVAALTINAAGSKRSSARKEIHHA
jgi:Tol biopolymer transport system component